MKKKLLNLLNVFLSNSKYEKAKEIEKLAENGIKENSVVMQLLKNVISRKEKIIKLFEYDYDPDLPNKKIFPLPENEISQIEKGLKILNLDFEKQVFLNNPLVYFIKLKNI